MKSETLPVSAASRGPGPNRGKKGTESGKRGTAGSPLSGGTGSVGTCRVPSLGLSGDV